FAVMDCGSGGMGAQTTIDGLDISSYEFQLGNGIPDVEINEGSYPMLYLWRKLNHGSGGPGFRRGGQGMDFAWTPWRTDGLTGTLENAMSCVPTRGLMGGYPGATNFFKVVRGTGLDKVLNDGGALPQSPQSLGGNEETLLNHITGVPLRTHEVFHQITGGGAGMGDPLLREPERVEGDGHRPVARGRRPAGRAGLRGPHPLRAGLPPLRVVLPGLRQPAGGQPLSRGDGSDPRPAGGGAAGGADRPSAVGGQPALGSW